MFAVFAVFAACSDEDAEHSVINNVYAPDVYAVYDGAPHYITIYNTLEGDIILYSVDGEEFTEISPAFTLPGSYTVYYKIRRAGYLELFSSAQIHISYAVLEGITAPDVTVFYDGLYHSITIYGVNPETDAVTYSTDGEHFSSAVPTFVDVGVYTVYYVVERGYAAERSSCTITILPNIRGRYFNPSFGVVEIDIDGAAVNGESADCSILPDGSGFISGAPFSVTDGTLIYDGNVFTKIAESECVYRLNAESMSAYFCAEESGSLTVTAEAETCLISLGGSTILSVPNANYCESAEIVSYVPLIFEQSFERSGEVTDVEVALSRREKNPFIPQTLYFICDGLPHTFDYSERFIYLDGEDCEYTEIGTYTAALVFLSDRYLPLVEICTLVIMPDLSGLYFSPERIIKIDGSNVYFDGEPQGKLTVLDGAATYDGIPLTPTENGIMYDGVEYESVSSPVLIFRANKNAVGRAIIPEKTADVTVVFDGSSVTFSARNDVFLTVALCASSIKLYYHGEELPPVATGERLTFVLGVSELSDDTVILDATTE
ncbi:MAG: hypothetical protein J1F39_01125 [Clostridiales bacterium]|nr:hypothetical protein [Clostridiales bacterium]